ncbi:hypothetical protein DFH08DRAFT_963648 [Mycena albidolilacea]|uniref:Uncharacterized protein n=1 Tax=Mycena albidolilacea TaxID=1033008 RepID=A0AAD7EMR5_9AGAR|nr:hypothetical protein DFH08DRAFT_963648 [Mycena albidolilacea]
MPDWRRERVWSEKWTGRRGRKGDEWGEESIGGEQAESQKGGEAGRPDVSDPRIQHFARLRASTRDGSGTSEDGDVYGADAEHRFDNGGGIMEEGRRKGQRCRARSDIRSFIRTTKHTEDASSISVPSSLTPATAAALRILDLEREAYRKAGIAQEHNPLKEETRGTQDTLAFFKCVNSSGLDFSPPHTQRTRDMANGASSSPCGCKEQRKAGMKEWRRASHPPCGQMAAASDAPSLLLLPPISSVLHPFSSSSSASLIPPSFYPVYLSSLLLRSPPHPSPIPTCVEAMLGM